MKKDSSKNYTDSCVEDVRICVQSLREESREQFKTIQELINNILKKS